MRIILIGPVYPYRGGIAHFTTVLAQKLQEGGDTVELISFKRQYPQFLYPGQSDKDPSQDAQKIEARFLLDPLYPWTWTSALRQISAFHPDLVIISWWTTFWAPAFGAMARVLKSKHVRMAYLVHNVLPHEASFIDRFLVKMAFGNCGQFIVLAQDQGKKLLEIFPQVSVNQCVHPIYPIFSGQNLSRDEAKSKLGFRAEDVIFLFFGIVRPYKGLKLLIDAMHFLHSENYRPHLIVAGEFWQDQRATLQEIESYHLEEYIHLYPRYIPNEEVGIFFSAADALVAPYIAGTQSGVVKIGLSFDLPMIVSETISRGDPLLENCPNVQIVDLKDPQQLADAMINTLSPQNPERQMKHSAPAPDKEWGDLIDTIHALA
jgi:D-inositol-3-phosphate glycosyltransferase